MIRQCPPLSIRVHPRGGQTNSVFRQVEVGENAAENRVQGVHPPNRPIAQGVRVYVRPPRTMVASEGWTVWTENIKCHERQEECLSRNQFVHPGGWTLMDTMDNSGWFAW